jgi:hypothetical protein
MSIENLCKSWGALAPQEVMLIANKFVKLLIPTKNNLSPHSLFRFQEDSGPKLSPLSKAIAMAWLTQCIEARGWGWNTGVYVGNHFSSGSSAWVNAETRVDIDGDRPVCALESLLTAYITAIAPRIQGF